MTLFRFTSIFCFAALTACAAKNTSPVIADASNADKRVDFLNLINRPRVPLTPQVATPVESAGFTEIRFSYASDSANRVPGIIVKPQNAHGKLPVIIALHGTGGSKNGEVTLLRRFAERGFLAVAVDAPYHGERTKNSRTHPNDYEDAMIRAWNAAAPSSLKRQTDEVTGKFLRREHPFFYDTVWDIMRLVDYLETRDDIDSRHIGLYGVSKGGIETYLTAAVDLRIAAAAPCIGVQSFRWALNHDQWQSRIGTIQPAFDAIAKQAGIAKPDSAFVVSFYNRVAPGIADRFDGPAMLPLIAPRPLMVINGDIDPRTPLEGLKLCTDAAQAAYHSHEADDHFVIRMQAKTGHKVNADSEAAAIDFFAKWFGPKLLSR